MKKILIVDDSTFMRSVVKDALENNNSDVKDALQFYEADGKQNAVSQVNKIKPDAILLDIVMKESEMEGIEFLEEIQPYFDMKKIIMISSIGQDEIMNMCKRMGVEHYLQKPIEYDEMFKVINYILK
jgi:two-component system chemotaxis response regulator CheY